MVKELLQPDLLLILAKGTLADQNDFFTGLYHRQEEWGNPLIEQSYLGEYTPDRNSGSVKLRSMEMNGNTFAEFEIFVDFAYSVSPFLFQWKNTLTAADYITYLNRVGIYNGPHGPSLIASDGTVLISHSLNTPNSYAKAWNQHRVPYERDVIKSNPIFPYIRDLAALGQDPTCFRMSSYAIPGY